MIDNVKDKNRRIVFGVVVLACLCLVSCKNITSLIFPNGTKLTIKNNTSSIIEITSFEEGKELGVLNIPSMGTLSKVFDDRENNRTIMTSLSTDSLVITRISDNTSFKYYCEGSTLFGPCFNSDELPNFVQSSKCTNPDKVEEGLRVIKSCTYTISDRNFE